MSIVTINNATNYKLCLNLNKSFGNTVDMLKQTAEFGVAHREFTSTKGGLHDKIANQKHADFVVDTK